MDCMAIGLKRCGKTTLCKALASEFRKMEGTEGVLVYDPMKGTWDADFVTANFKELARTAQNNRNCYIIIDECFTLSDKEDKRVLTNMMAFGRHYGHTMLMIGQRFTAIPPTARNLCERLFVFKQSPKDAEAIYEDYAEILARELPEFERGEYLDLTTFSCERRRIF